MDIFFDDFVDGAVVDELVESLVDLVEKFGIALGDSNSIGFFDIFSVKDLEPSVVGFDIFLSRFVVDDDTIDFIGDKSLDCIITGLVG